jgi:hypothetical protein
MVRILALRHAGLAAVFLVASCASDIASPSDTTDVCSIIGHASQYYGQRLTVRGIVRTDYFEFSGLTGEACMPTFISFGPERTVEVGLAEFEDALERVRDEPTQVVEVVVDGTLEQRAGQIPNVVLVVHRFTEIRQRALRTE